MATPASELQKLLELRDREEITAEEFATLKARLLSPVPQARPPRRSNTRLAGIPTWMLALGGLIGGTTLLAMTEVGALALGGLIVLGFVLIVVMAIADTGLF
ncbi:SHOCT domain-containing protein [Jannaschia ovalis]|uniref:SHOCT domain-containing protein n=1 Tax=Jannaschia ovalis TaxID=3038773 RepID=A0ABY8L830_9RHOB|nr:SHOCT domain-containing protein [Jannaschia sp. GRR-S6-38]WGH77532.1 SHOCT domain-containing protein [Jannaschia sp. GRR-S6-38]